MVTSCRLLNVGLNDTYEFTVAAATAASEPPQKYILRVYRHGWRTHEEILYELDMLTHLKERGAHVAAPIAGRDGRLSREVGAPEGMRYAAVFTFVTGKQPDHTEQVALRYGVGAAAVHNASEGYEPPYARFRIDLDHLITEPLHSVLPFLAARPDDQAHLQTLADKLRRGVEALPLADLETGFCHGDFHGGNVLFDADTGEPTFFDFDCGGPGWRAYDIAVNRWSARLAGAEDVKWPAFLRGYTAHRPLADIDIAATPWFVAIRHLWLLGLHAGLARPFGGGWLNDEYWDRQLAFLRGCDDDYLAGKPSGAVRVFARGGGREKEIEERMAAAHVPGLALAVVQGGAVVYAKGFGVASVEEKSPVTPETLFRVGSLSKPFTGTAVMRLAEAGKLDIDAPVNRYLPWFTLSDPDAAPAVTLRMLLTHTSGLPHDHRPDGPRDAEALERRIRTEIPRYALVARPGERFHYSNAGIHVLAHVAETVTGQPYAELMRDLVFEPLAMTRTTFDPYVAMTYPLAQAHDLAAGTLAVQRPLAYNSANAASGQAFSTVTDLANFALLHLSGGLFRGARLLSEESIAAMHRPAVAVDSASPTGRHYGLTFFVSDWRGHRCVGHSGGITTFRTRFDLLPDAGIAVMMAYNRIAAEFDADGIVDEVLERLVG
jgi:CubicO group peptidase (beta-lactamase class C family)/Ser/Thr protein kinase RdoA (MazF antagonist)